MVRRRFADVRIVRMSSGKLALVRGPEGSLIQTPAELFAAAKAEGVAIELNLMCIHEILRAFAGSGARADEAPSHVSPDLKEPIAFS